MVFDDILINDNFIRIYQSYILGKWKSKPISIKS